MFKQGIQKHGIMFESRNKQSFYSSGIIWFDRAMCHITEIDVTDAESYNDLIRAFFPVKLNVNYTYIKNNLVLHTLTATYTLSDSIIHNMWLETVNVQYETLSDREYNVLFENDVNPFVYYDAKCWTSTNPFLKIDSILYSNINEDLSEDTITMEQQFHLNSNKPFIYEIEMDNSNDKYKYPDYATVQNLIEKLQKYR
jgi:hypothetical protein